MNEETIPVLTTTRLLLRSIGEDDLESVYRGLSEPEVTRFYGVSYTGLEESREQLLYYAKVWKQGTGCYWAICNRESGVFMGVAGFCNYAAVHRRAEIACWLLPAFRGKGFMHESILAIMEYGNKYRKVHRWEGLVEPENTACKKAIHKLGFSLESVFRECEWKNNHFISLEMYGYVPEL